MTEPGPWILTAVALGKDVDALTADRAAWRAVAGELAGALQESRLVAKSLLGAARDADDEVLIAYAFRAIRRIDTALAAFDKLKGDE